MSKSKVNDEPIRNRGWALAISAIAAWVLLATNSADAQEIRVPDFVLAQVLGSAVRVTPAIPESAPSVAGEGAAVNLVADRMRQNFEDQLVAGVSRPSVELEVRFDFDSEQIHGESDPEIAAAAEVLNKYFPDTRFRVAGFTDAAGSADYNMRLSERRAIAVWKSLVDEHGVNAERLERVGFGEEDPSLAATDAQRRRVELQILRDVGGTL